MSSWAKHGLYPLNTLLLKADYFSDVYVFFTQVKKKKKKDWLSALEYGAQMWIRNTGWEVLLCFKIADHLDLNPKRDFQSYRASETAEDR